MPRRKIQAARSKTAHQASEHPGRLIRKSRSRDHCKHVASSQLGGVRIRLLNHLEARFQTVPPSAIRLRSRACGHAGSGRCCTTSFLPARIGGTRCRSILDGSSAREPSGVWAATRSQPFDTGRRARLLAIARMADAATRRRVTPPTLSMRSTTGVRPRELQRRQAVKKRAKKEPK